MFGNVQLVKSPLARAKAFVFGLVAMLMVSLASLQTHAAAAADTATVEKIESINLTLVAGFAVVLTIITASLGIRIYKKLGKRAIGAA